MSRRIITVIVLVAASTAAAVPVHPHRVRPAAATAAPVPVPVEPAVDLRAVRAVSRSMVRTAPPQVTKKVVVPKPVKKKVVQKQVTVVTIPATGVRALGQRMAAARGWTGAQWVCLDNLINRESHWRVTAANPSGAYGIFQALPGSKMGPGWQTSATVQIRWGLGYIASRYGTPCGAWAHSQATGWY